MFFQDLRGYSYPIARVASVGLPKEDTNAKGRWTNEVTLIDERAVRVSDTEAHKILSMGTVVPASPGFFIIDAEGKEVFRSEIIAWVVAAEGPPLPVTVDGPNDGVDQILNVLTPSGTVVRAGQTTWPTLDSWLNDTQRPGYTSVEG